MFDVSRGVAGVCWGFGNKETDENKVCDDWAPEPGDESTGGQLPTMKTATTHKAEVRAKYTQEEIDALGAKGHAFKNEDGTYSYPIDDVEDLKKAIRAVGRGNADHDAIRKYVIGRAKDLDESDLIPDNWNADGSLSDADEKTRVWATQEQRDTAMDVFATLDGAVADALAESFYYVWVQDWYGSGSDPENPYTVIYCAGGDLWAAEFSYDEEGKVTVDVDGARKVRPCTTYIDRSKQKRNHALASRPKIDPELRAAREGMRGEREERRMPAQGFEMREQTSSSGDTVVVCAGYASLTCADMSDETNAYEMEDAFGPWVESTVRGFATKTIREDCDTAFLVNHTGVTMARTKAGSLDLEERLDGLFYEGRLNPTRPDVQILRAAVQDGAIDESSFAFRVVRQKWSDDYTRRWIQEINLDKGDVSPVNYAANPNTGGHLSMRSAMALLGARGITSRGFLGALQELRAGKTISQSTRDVLEPILANLAAIDKMVDADQPKLAELLGVDNPDEDEPEGTDEGEERSTQVLVLPDHTTAARAALARVGRR